MPTVDIATVSVAEYATRIAGALRAVGGAAIEGEVQRPTRTERGMLFFELTDGEARLACKVFPRDVRRLQHLPSHGDLVQVTVDRPDFYPQQGRVSVIVSAVALAGVGELLRRREELLRRLTVDGLCDRDTWKPLPRFPRAVGVIAGRGSDGLSDVVRALQDRWPPVHIVTCAARVQGVEAPRELVDALARMQSHPLVDIVVLARGGGSVQDLVAFDDERVCRAVHACDVPVVCAVGHTDNVPVCNHVTHHAATPSRSPELAVPDVAEVRAQLRLAATRLGETRSRLGRCADRIAALRAHVDARRLPARDALDALAAKIEARASSFFSDRAARLDFCSERVGVVEKLLGSRCELVEADARRVSGGLRRQLSDHERDYGHALSRLGREALRGCRTALARHEERVGRAAPLVRERAMRVMCDAERAARNLCALVRARDFRGQGWLLASDSAGRPLAAARALSPQERLRLHFHDGDVDAVAQNIDLQEEDSE